MARGKSSSKAPSSKASKVAPSKAARPARPGGRRRGYFRGCFRCCRQKNPEARRAAIQWWLHAAAFSAVILSAAIVVLLHASPSGANAAIQMLRGGSPGLALVAGTDGATFNGTAVLADAASLNAVGYSYISGLAYPSQLRMQGLASAGLFALVLCPLAASGAKLLDCHY